MDKTCNSRRLASKRPAPSGNPTRQKPLRRSQRLRKIVNSSHNKTSASADLCSRCRHMDWKSLPTTPRLSNIIRINETREQLLASGCCICLLIGTVVPRGLDIKSFQLVAYDCLEDELVKESDAHYNIILEHIESREKGVARIGLSSIDEEEISGIEATTNNVNFKWTKECLEYCKKPRTHDGETHWDAHYDCRNLKKVGRPQNFRVIGCKSRDHDIINAPAQCQYAALSYVWGTSGAENSTTFSQVVADAIKVTVSIGLQYLWVDKHV